MRNDPFFDWRYPALPCTWQRGYYDQPHVQQVTQAIEHCNDGLLTLRELLYRLEASYSNGYASGKEDAHFPVPAIPNHLYFIAAEPMEPHIDFKAIGWYGLHTSQY